MSEAGLGRELWFTRCPVPSALGLAVRLGYVQEVVGYAGGVALRSLASSSSAEVRQSHFLHGQAWSLRHGGNMPPIVAASRGAALRIVALSWTSSRIPILVAPDSPIRGTADLRGKRLSVPRRLNDPVDFWRGAALRGWERALTDAGLTVADVDLVDLPIARSYLDATEVGAADGSLWSGGYMLGFQREEVTALLRGEVDAIVAQSSLGASAQAALGLRAVYDVGAQESKKRSASNDSPLVFTMGADLVDEAPDLAAAVLRASMRATDWAVDNELESKQLISAEVGLPDGLVEAAYSSDVHRELGLNLDDDNVAALEEQLDLFRRREFLAGPVDLASLIDPRPLALAQAASVVG